MVTDHKSEKSDTEEVSANEEIEKSGQEIVVTPEMIDAGVECLMNYDERYDNREDAVRKIYTEMASRGLIRNE